MPTPTRRRRRPRRWLDAARLCFIAAFAAATIASPGKAEPIAPADAAKLENLFRQDCGSCHGLTLRGGLGKPLTAESLKQWDRDQLAAIILYGVPGTPMPPWGPLISEAEARWIADMLKGGRAP